MLWGGTIQERTKTRNGSGNELKNRSRFVAIQVVGRASTVVVYQHRSPECSCKFLLPCLRAWLAKHYRKKKRYTASWSCSPLWQSGNEVRCSQSSGTIQAKVHKTTSKYSLQAKTKTQSMPVIMITWGKSLFSASLTTPLASVTSGSSMK